MSQGTLTAKIRTALLAGALLLAGCGQEPEPQLTEEIDTRQSGAVNYSIEGWDDPLSGCKYFATPTYPTSSWIITPRFWANGQPMCPGNKP